MANQLGDIVETVVKEGNLSGNVRTSFGLPGYHRLPSYCVTDYVIRSRVMDDMSVEVCFKGGSRIYDEVVKNTYGVRFVASKGYWDWSYDGNSYAIFPSDAVQMAEANIVVPGDISASRGHFNWNLPADQWVRVCALGDLGYDPYNPSDAYLWVGGTGDYKVDHPIYPAPVRIILPKIRLFSSYYPLAVRMNTFLSCNRPGGAVKRLSGDWQDVKNFDNNPDQSKAFIRSSNNWNVAPKVGEQG